jgi:hypothetical protein
MIELTEQQRRALAERGCPAEVVDPATQHTYVLLAADQYEQVRGLLEHPPREEPVIAVAPGIRRSQAAMRRDLPGLLADPRLRGKFVAYHGDERVGIADRMWDLIEECQRRGLADDTYDIGVIEPVTLIEEEEVGYGLCECDEDEPEGPDDLSTA